MAGFCAPDRVPGRGEKSGPVAHAGTARSATGCPTPRRAQSRDRVPRYPLDVRRRLLIAAIFLLAGAVVNVAVAWSYAIDGWLPEGRQAQTVQLIEAEAKQVFADRLVVVTEPTRGYEERSIGRTFLVVCLDPQDLGDHHVQVLTTGWPCLALEGPWTLMNGRLKAGWLLITRWERRNSVVTFPLHPIWPGFAVNTLLYATFLWLLIPGPFVLRRFLRVRRGLCPACAYDLRHGEHDACPECGRLPSGR